MDRDLLEEVDRAAANDPLHTRSAVIEEAVRRWARHGYEQTIREYYAAVTVEERAEDDAWAEHSAHELGAVLTGAPDRRRSQKKARRR